MSEMDDQIEMLRRLGQTYREISTALGCDSYQIRRVVEQRGLPSRESAQAAVEVYIRAGMKPYKAAEMVGVDKSVAYRVQRAMRREAILDGMQGATNG